MNLQKQKFGIAIYDNEIILQDFTKDEAPQFVVTREQLMQFFSAEITFKPFPGLIWMKMRGDQTRYLFTLPEGRRGLIYKPNSDETQIKYLKLPNILAMVIAKDGRITHLDVWGYKGELLPTTKLFELPLPNLSKSSMCIGSNDFSSHDILKSTEELLFDTPFNTHRYLVGKDSIPFPDYVKKHRGYCPMSSLKPLGTFAEVERRIR